MPGGSAELRLAKTVLQSLPAGRAAQPGVLSCDLLCALRGSPSQARGSVPTWVNHRPSASWHLAFRSARCEADILLLAWTGHLRHVVRCRHCLKGKHRPTGNIDLQNTSAPGGQELAGVSPASGKQMGHAGELTVRDSERRERLALCGRGPAWAAPEAQKAVLPSSYFPSETQGRGQHTHHPHPTPQACPFCCSC